MRRISKTSSLFAIVALAIGAACTDQIPTLSDPDQFPGALPTTIQFLVGPSDLVLRTDVFPGGTDINDVFFKLVARDFDGALSSNLLAQFDSFPSFVTTATRVDSAFVYEDSRVTATLPDTLRVTSDVLEFELWTVVQDWESTAVSWENAVERPAGSIPWIDPGGTRGVSLGRAVWSQAAATADADSLNWELPAEIITQLANGELPGLMVTMSTSNARAEISSLVIEAHMRPESADTVVTEIVHGLDQTFVFTPEAPRPTDVLRIGGITSDRALLNLSLETTLPACPDADPSCTDRLEPVRVSLNRVDLILDPLPVPDGFRPITSTRLSIRRLLEPELGARAPLGGLIAEDTITKQRFVEPDSEPIIFNVTGAVTSALRRGDTELAIAILIEPEASTPSYVWLGRNVRLRFVYTLPQRPQLP